ncbi:hypothetical protein U6Y60_13665 [Lacticaseibacillus paracasei]|uniref:hypothetical protein n=1 Tax=Lacticaseibacillus paracasei TaxID=1597 RepID=UPI002ADEB69B|nr:hypothetical protein [Lacticaseibacillus paracasei]MEA0974433.1 hypothetical protein [Lacticaseibacillus paracasei]
MLKHLITDQGTEFVYDNKTVAENGTILTANFILLRAEKVIRLATKKSNGEQYEAVDYQYSSQFFRHLQMCHLSDIKNDTEADDTLIDLYERISTGKSLSKELRQMLRNKYLKIIDLRN